MDNPLFWLGVFVVCGVLLYWSRRHFSAEAKARRRLYKSNRPVISTREGPTVKLAVNTEKSKKK